MVETAFNGLASLVVAYALVHFTFRFVFRIHEETQRRAEELSALQETMLDITGQLDMSQLLAAIIERARKLVGATGGLIHLYDAERGELRCCVSHNLEKDYTGLTLAVGEGVAGKVVQSGEPLVVTDHRTWEGKSAQVADSAARAVVAVPLKWRDEIIGVLDIMNTSSEKSFDERDVHLLTLFANQAAIAIQNARLYEEIHRRAERLAVVNHIARAVIATLHLDDLLETVYQEITRVFEADAFFLALYDQEAKELDFRLQVDEGVREAPERRPLSPGLTSQVVTTKKPLLIRDFEKEKDKLPPAKLWGTMKIPPSWLGVPMRIGDRVVGVISVQAYRPHAYGEEEQQLLSTIADQVAVAIENARLYEAQRRRTEQLAALNTISLTMGQSLETDKAMGAALEATLEVIGFEVGAIALWDEQERRLRPVATRCADSGPEDVFFDTLRAGGLRELALNTGQPVFIDDTAHDPRVNPAIARKGLTLSAIVPLTCKGRVLGILAVATRSPRQWTEDEKSLLTTIGHQIGVALENAQLLASLTQEKERLGLLYRLGRHLSESLDIHDVAQRALDEMCAVVGALRGVALVREPGSDRLRLVAISGYDAESVQALDRRLCLRLGDGLAGWVALQRQPALVDDVTKDEHWMQVSGLDDWVRSALSVPLLSGDELVGVFSLYSNQEAFFHDEHRQLAEATAATVAVAIENARLFETEQRRRQEAEMLRQAALALTTSLDWNQVVESLLARLQRVVPYDSASVQLLKDGQLEIVGGRGFPNLPELLGISFAVDGDNPNREVVRNRAPFIVDDAPAVYDDFRREPHAQARIRSWLGVPMLVGDRFIGMIALDKREPGFYTPQHARLAQAFASQAAIAIENARLFRREREQRELAEALAEAGAALIRTLDFDQVLDRILEQVGRVIPNDAANIMLIQGDRVRIARWRGYDRFGAEEFVSTVNWPISEVPNLQRMKESGEPMVIPDTATYPGWVHVPVQEWLRSYAAAPIIVRGEVIGFLNVDSATPGFFSQAHLGPLQAFAAQAAIAIENARLYEETQRRLQEMSLLNEINVILTSTLDLENMLTSLMQRIYQALGVEAASLFLVDEKRQALTFHIALGKRGAEVGRLYLPLGVGIAGWVVQQGEPLLVQDVKHDPRHYPEIDRLVGFVTKSVLCVPLKIKDQVLGCIEAINKVQGEFSQDDLRLLSAVAASAATAIENAQLYEKVRGYAASLEQKVAARTEEIRREKERTEAILRSVADAVIVTDLEGEIVEANPVAERWLLFRKGGRTLPNIPLHRFVRRLAGGEVPEEAPIIEFPAFVQPDLPACWEVQDCGKTACPAYGREERCCWLILGTLCGHGREAISLEEKCGICERCSLYQRLKKVSFQARVSHLKENGRTVGSVIVLHDVTRLQELDRLKSEFVSNVSHELRTPLTNIKLYLPLLRSRGAEMERRERYLRTLERETARLEKLIEDLLDLSRLEMGAAQPHKELLDVAEVVQQVLLVHQPLAESRGIQLSSELPPDLPPLPADRNQMIQLLTNLLGNALNYTSPGGEVTVRAASARREGRDWLTLAVQDTGPGIPPEEQERIFDRFYRGKEARHKAPGTGLGLPIVKEILALHGGFIELESEVGVGSTFTAWLPLEGVE